MKIQDLAFLIAFLFVLWRRNGRLAIIIGLLCLFLAIPLFKLWIFFTAERLTWYAAVFFLYAIILSFPRKPRLTRRKQESIKKRNENWH